MSLYSIDPHINEIVAFRNPNLRIGAELSGGGCCPETNEKLDSLIELLSKSCAYVAGLNGTSTTILGAVHGLDTANLSFDYFTIGTDEQVADVSGFVATVDNTTFDVTITANAPMDGLKVIISNPAC
jgi:hypothetical protein